MPMPHTATPIASPLWTFNMQAIGTQWRIDTTKPLSHELKQLILARVEKFDQTYSRFRYDSLIHKVAENAGSYTFPEDALELIAFYQELYELTAGEVTPLIGNVLEAAGYDMAYSLVSKKPSPVQTWSETMRWDGTTLTTSNPITLDLGAAGKGYLVDIIANILIDNSHDNFIIDASGDIKHYGSVENIVGLEHPHDPTIVIGIVSVQNASLCASAVNRRRWGKGLHHIFSPTTLRPVDTIIASWVIAKDALIADGLATALFFAEPAKLQNAYEFEYVRIHADNTIDYSSHFSGELYI